MPYKCIFNSYFTHSSNNELLKVNYVEFMNNIKENGILTFDKTPQLKYRKALAELDKINFDDSNGINQLLEGF